MSDHPPLSLSAVREELEELRKDYIAFSRALDILRARILESTESSRSEPPLHQWSGTHASVGSLEMAIQIIHRNIEEHNRAIDLILNGEIVNVDAAQKPKLEVIDGGDDSE